MGDNTTWREKGDERRLRDEWLEREGNKTNLRERERDKELRKRARHGVTEIMNAKLTET